MPSAAKVVHKKTEDITSLPLYHSGRLQKKHSKEKDFKRYYAELRGVTLFLYKDDTQNIYIEKLDLEQLKSMELDSPYQKKKPTIFTLTLPTEEVQLKMDDADTGEEWKGYILTVAKKEIPSKLQLLPVQMLKLQDTLAQERRRNSPGSCPPLPSKPAFLQCSVSGDACSSATEDKSVSEIPACFFDVTREEAERMLEANPEYGGIIIRPSAMANNYALTLRQLTPRGPVMKNFRVTYVNNSGFVIELEKTVTLPTLNDVLQYFLEKTEYRLCPYMPFQPYATRIEVDPAPKSIGINSPADKKTVPDDHNPKLAQFCNELRKVVFEKEQQRQQLDDSSDDKNGYTKKISTKSPSSTVWWTNTAGDSKA